MRKLMKLALGSGLLLGSAGCDLLGSNNKVQENQVATATTKVASAAGRLCAANATYARLKESAFDEAKRIRERDTESLDALADASVVRMENPLLESRDDALGLTVCSGRMILELPPGAGAAFDGRQRLAADVTYSAQATADGSGTVFKIDGGEPIVYRLAGFDPRRGATRTASIENQPLDTSRTAPADPDPMIDMPVTPAPAPLATPALPVPDGEAERARLAADRAARAAAASRAAASRAAAAARQERAEAAERSARAERVAEARRTERGERMAAREDRPARAASPSFNCRYARSRVERLVCGSDDLAARDREMATVFYRANDGSDARTRRALSASRLRFLAYRDRCPNEACVAAAYDDRIDEINDIANE